MFEIFAFSQCAFPRSELNYKLNRMFYAQLLFKAIGGGMIMNENQLKGIVKDAAGKIQESAGKLTGSTTQQAKGLQKQAAGKAEKLLGDVEENLKESKDAIKERMTKK